MSGDVRFHGSWGEKKSFARWLGCMVGLVGVLIAQLWWLAARLWNDGEYASAMASLARVGIGFLELSPLIVLLALILMRPSVVT